MYPKASASGTTMKHAAAEMSCHPSTTLLLAVSWTWALHVDPVLKPTFLGHCCSENGKGNRCVLCAQSLSKDMAEGSRRNSPHGNMRICRFQEDIATVNTAFKAEFKIAIRSMPSQPWHLQSVSLVHKPALQVDDMLCEVLSWAPLSRAL